MGEILMTHGALGGLGLLVLIFGFAPGMVLAAIVRLIPDVDRRRELQAELYEVPRWDRPFWVAQQFEVAIRIGLSPQLAWYWGRYVWHRARIESGLENHRRYPDSFWVPSDEEKAELQPGDTVRLMWSVKRYEAAGERMWVKITQRDGDRVVGKLQNWPIFVHLDPDAVVKFHIDDILDFNYHQDDESAGEAGTQRFPG